MKVNGVSAIVTLTTPATKAVSEGQSALHRRRGGEENEGKFASLRQQQGDPHRVVVAGAEETRQPVKDRGLHEHHHHDHASTIRHQL